MAKNKKIINEECFRTWAQDLPKFEYIIQSWNVGILFDYSTCTTWGVFKIEEIKYVMLLSMFHHSVGYNEVRKMVFRLANNYTDVFLDKEPKSDVLRSDIILMDDYPLYEQLRQAKLEHIAGVENTKDDDISKFKEISYLIENGLVWVQKDSTAEEFLTLVDKFPNDENAVGIINSMSRALYMLKNKQWIRGYNPNSEEHLKHDAETVRYFSDKLHTKIGHNPGEADMVELIGYIQSSLKDYRDQIESGLIDAGKRHENREFLDAQIKSILLSLKALWNRVSNMQNHED